MPMNRLPTSGPDSGQRIARDTRPNRSSRAALNSALLMLQTLFATQAGASTLTITRVDAIRDKMAAIDANSVPQPPPQAPVQFVQWAKWGNWGNWPGWLPKRAQKWRWPRF